MFHKRMMLGYVLLCLVFFLPIEATKSIGLTKPLIALDNQKSYEAITISIECQAYHRTLLLVRGYTRQHAPCYVVHGLKKIIADYAYEPPVLTGGAPNLRKHKWCVCVASFFTTVFIGGSFVGFILYSNNSVHF